MKEKCFLLIAWCQVLMAAKTPNPTVDVVLTELQTENYAKNIVTLLEIHFVPWQGRKAISGVYNHNQIIPDMHMKFTLNFVKPDKTRFEVMDLMINVCSFLNGTYDKMKIPRILLHELRKQKGIPRKCPILAKTNYTLENYTFEVPKFPLPNLKFIATVTLYQADKKTKILRISVKGATKRYKS